MMKTLLDSTQIGSMALKNRFISAAIGDFVEAGGHVTDSMRKKYETLAKGGVGTIITGFTLVDETEGAFNIPAMYADSFVGEYKELIDSVHAYEANIILQLVYIGSYVMGDPGDRPILGPSAVENLHNGIVPKEITLSEIKDIQSNFAQAAVRAKKAGFDGIELHAAHGFLLSQFLMPYYNHRSDIYGGSIENRARMILETYSIVREAVGNDYPIWIKINCTDGIEGGISIDDFRYICTELTKLGVNAIEVSGNWMDRSKDTTAYFKNEAATIAKETGVAVVLTGGNRDYSQMEELLNNTDIGYFGMARPFISEPDLPMRFEKGHSKKIRCVNCNACATPESAGSCIFNKSV
jgi:2,4-dienoyl-CoA reductase-like NADH-dependent reductase (Old Yellow Enzyme family)